MTKTINKILNQTMFPNQKMMKMKINLRVRSSLVKTGLGAASLKRFSDNILRRRLKKSIRTTSILFWKKPPRMWTQTRPTCEKSWVSKSVSSTSANNNKKKREIFNKRGFCFSAKNRIGYIVWLSKYKITKLSTSLWSLAL